MTTKFLVSKIPTRGLDGRLRMIIRRLNKITYPNLLLTNICSELESLYLTVALEESIASAEYVSISADPPGFDVTSELTPCPRSGVRASPAVFRPEPVAEQIWSVSLNLYPRAHVRLPHADGKYYATFSSPFALTPSHKRHVRQNKGGERLEGRKKGGRERSDGRASSLSIWNLGNLISRVCVIADSQSPREPPPETSMNFPRVSLQLRYLEDPVLYVSI